MSTNTILRLERGLTASKFLVNNLNFRQRQGTFLQPTKKKKRRNFQVKATIERGMRSEIAHYKNDQKRSLSSIVYATKKHNEHQRVQHMELYYTSYTVLS